MVFFYIKQMYNFIDNARYRLYNYFMLEENFMKIIKYEKKKNDEYLIYFDDGNKINIKEDVILKYKLLYKKEIDNNLVKKLMDDNLEFDVYDKCVRYISVRLRSINEIREYMLRKGVDDLVIEDVICRLIKNKLLDDDRFAMAFIKDKLNFTTMGPYRIELELKKHKIDDSIIKQHIYDIDDKIINDKINKQINKIIKSNKNKPNLKNKVYSNLLNLGYSSECILENLSKYNL